MGDDDCVFRVFEQLHYQSDARRRGDFNRRSRECVRAHTPPDRFRRFFPLRREVMRIFFSLPTHSLSLSLCSRRLYFIIKLFLYIILLLLLLR